MSSQSSNFQSLSDLLTFRVDPEVKLSDIPRMQSLACDYTSLIEGLAYLLSVIDTIPDGDHRTVISQIQVLDLSPALAGQDEVAALLSETMCLREVILRGGCCAFLTPIVLTTSSP